MAVSPVYKEGNTLRDYQLEGVNWLTFCWCNRYMTKLHENCFVLSMKWSDNVEFFSRHLVAKEECQALHVD